MNLTEKQKQKIDDILLTFDGVLSFEERHEKVMDTCLDEEVFNLEHDDDGDMYEEYSNLVWEYIEEKEA